jgi:hypothetical protein
MKNFKVRKYCQGFSFFLIFAVLIFVYLKTLLPTVGFWDTGEFQTIPYTLNIGHPTGYPTYILLGRAFISLFPLNSIAWKMNFLSALLISSGCLIIGLLLYKVHKNIMIVILASLSLGLSKNIWEIALRAEVHSLHFFLTSLFLFFMAKIVLLKKINFFPLLFLLTSFSLGNHLLSIFFLPVLVLITIYFSTKKLLTKKLVAFSLLAFFLGLTVYLFLPIAANHKAPLTFDYQVNTWRGFKRHVFGQDFQSLMLTWRDNSLFLSFKYYSNLVLKNFSWVTLAIAVIGLLAGLRQKTFFYFLLIILFLPIVLFSLSYQNAALERYFISSFIIITVFFATGLNVLEKLMRAALKNIKNLNLSIFSTLILFIIVFFPLYFKYKKNYKLVDQSHNFSALNFALSTFQHINYNGVIISWWSYSTPLWYIQKVEGLRSDIKIYNLSHWQWEDVVLENINNRPVYLIEPYIFKKSNLTLEKTGNIYQVKLINGLTK